MNTQRSFYFANIERGRKALEAIADFLLSHEVSQDGPFMPLAMTPLEHDEPAIPRPPMSTDEMDEWESQIPGGFRVGHPIDLDDPKEPLSDEVLIFRRRVQGPVDCNPYYQMQKHYMGDKPHTGNLDQIPMSTPWLFIQGVESIYVQPQHGGVPGYWVMINCKRTSAGFELLEALDLMFSEEPPAPILAPQVKLQLPLDLFNSVADIARLMEQSDYTPYADTLYEILKLLAQIRPQEFQGELIYVWEELMRHYTTVGDLDHAVTCLETQAILQPDLSDPWLNLGFVYNMFGHQGKALDTYLEGISHFPKDEFIHHNLASLLMNLGHHGKALLILNEAILANPDRAVNYKLKGDIHAQREELELATYAYQQAVLLSHEEEDWFKDQCIHHLSVCLIEQGNHVQAEELRTAYKKGHNLIPVLSLEDDTHSSLFSLYGSVDNKMLILDKFFPGILNEMDLFTEEDTLPLTNFADVTGHILVLQPEALKPAYRKPAYQLWRCHGGSGARRRSKGSNLNAQCLADSEKAGWDRNRWLGVLHTTLIPKAETILGQKLKAIEKP